MKKLYYVPTIECLEDRVPLSTSPLAGPPASDCVLMRTMEQHHSMEILMSPEHCCSSELVVHIEHAHLVIHLPPAFKGRIVRIEGSDARGAVGPDGHVNLPFVESAGTITLTMTNHEGDNIPFLRVTHDGHGTITNKQCLIDLQKLLEEEEHEHPHAAHEEHFHPHAPHEEHAEHPHSPHIPHMEHSEKHENHEPHPPHEEHKESPLEEHETPEEGSHQPMERHENPRERDDRLLFEEAIQFGSWWRDDATIVEGDTPPQEKEQQKSAPAALAKELWPIIGGATVAAAALAGAYALERKAVKSSLSPRERAG